MAHRSGKSAGKRNKGEGPFLLRALLPPTEPPTFSASTKPLCSPRFSKRREWSGHRLCLAAGALTVETVHWLGRLLRRAWTPVGAALQRGGTRLLMPVRRAGWECGRLGQDIRRAGGRLWAAGRQGVRAFAAQAAALPGALWRRHWRFCGFVFQTALLVFAVTLLAGVLRYWQQTTFALELVYGGRMIGYITDEETFQDALNMAEGRVVKNTGEYTIEREPKLTLRPVQQSAVMSETELCDTILRMSGNSIAPMSGLYVNGAFEGALESHERMQGLLDEILAAYDTEADTVEKKAEFVGRVEIVGGLYPVTAAEPYEEMYGRMTAVGEDGLPYLGVQIRCTEVYAEPIPFETETVRDNSKYIGYSGVRVAGQPGERRVTADVIYVNGVEQYREILREETVREPVTQVVAVGAYRVNANAQPGVSTGTFLWPLPSCRTIYSPFGTRDGRRHSGIDISGNGVMGKDILAADGGRVLQTNTAGWGSGYGLYVILDHGNGYVTMYAHCSEVLVEPGDAVTQGQLIARVGNTGNSFGAHLHFEIRVNGSAVDPTPYLM